MTVRSSSEQEVTVLRSLYFVSGGGWTGPTGTGKPPEADLAALSSKQQAQASTRPDSAKPFTLRAHEAAGGDAQGVRVLLASMEPLLLCTVVQAHTVCGCGAGKELQVQKALDQWVKQGELMGDPEACERRWAILSTERF